MIAWLAARCDPPRYGELVVFQLPKDRLVLGPTQIEATIDQDTTISRQLSLWDQHGSRVLRGNLLVIPVGDAFLYVEPVYLRAEDSEIPQLQRVIVSDGARVAMEPTLRGALAAVLAGGPPTEAAGEPRAVGPSAGLSGARDAVAAAEAALADDGDPWEAFAAFMRRVVDADTHSLTLNLAGTFTPTHELYRESARAQALNERLFERTRAAGAIRPDVEVDDLALLFEQIASIRLGDEARTAVLRRRYLALVLDALRAAQRDGGQVQRADVVSAALRPRERRGAIGPYAVRSNGAVEGLPLGLYRLEGDRFRLVRALP
jgi:hypothetical protein